MNIESLKMFCLVVEEGTISQAARLSFVTQPAVTRQIRQLEEAYKTQLFKRHSGKLILSKAGELLYPYAKEIVEYTKLSFDAIQELNGNEEIVLNIGASYTLGEYLLPGILGEFSRNYPDLKFSLSIGNTPTILAKLEINEIDIAFVEGAVNNDELIREKFAEDELILVTSLTHAWGKKEQINIQELPEEKMIWREANSGTRLIVEAALSELGVLEEIKSTMELGSYQSIKNAVEANLGVSILPKLTVTKEISNGSLHEVKIKNLLISRDLWMVQKSHRFKKSGLKYFLQFIRQ
ncbi:LysR family transcriptional regulator [Niallia circulans]|uniref:LysR substrate-binding domain-containing protein n=1 Tax=Niallia circulans TaxID=1397 RepID=UPI000F4534F0|nr:LysR substrate-binding domain-containing protein [Niallia circulans]AYV66117.1 LysR family transcriptional regulator [Niallia circulans]